MCGRKIGLGFLALAFCLFSLSPLWSQGAASTAGSPSLESSLKTLYEIALRQQADLIERRKVEESLSFSFSALSGDLTKAMLKLESSNSTLTKLEANYAALKLDLTKSVLLSESSLTSLAETKTTLALLSEELKTLRNNLASISASRTIELWAWRGAFALAAGAAIYLAIR